MDWVKDFNLILVSGSPRRKELMEKMDLNFSVATIDVEEIYPENISIEKVAEFLAGKKFKVALNSLKPDKKDILITADTLVIRKGQLLGKPANIEEAKSILSSLSDTSNKVITGVCLGNKSSKICFSSISKVFFEDIEEDEIDYYIKNYQVSDKAGAYGIQDWIGVCKIRKIEGSYTNIMGFPTQLFYKKLKEFFAKIN